MVLFRRIAQVVENTAGLDLGEPVGGVEPYDPVQVFRAIDQDCDIAALPRKTRAASSHHDRGAMPSAQIDSRGNVFNAPRYHDADRNLPVVRCIGGIKGTAAIVETHLAFDRPFEVSSEF